MSGMRLKALVVAAVLAGGAAATLAQAQQPSRDTVAAAQRFMQAAGVSEQFEAVMPIMAQNLANMLIAQNPAKSGEISEIMKRLNDRILARKKELFDEIAVEHARQFTVAELDALTKFFSSGVGAKYIKSQPVLTKRSMEIGQLWGNRIGQEIDAEMRKQLR